MMSYRRGSLHNKVGMTILWVYYVLIILMVIIIRINLI